MPLFLKKKALEKQYKYWHPLCTYIHSESTCICSMTHSLALVHHTKQYIKEAQDNQKVVNSLWSGSFLTNFSSLSAPTKIEELTAGSDGKKNKQRSSAGDRFFVWSGCQFFYLCRSWKRRELDNQKCSLSGCIELYIVSSSACWSVVNHKTHCTT